MVKKNSNYICYQPNKSGKYLCYIFLILVGASLILFFVEGIPVMYKVFILLLDLPFIWGVISTYKSWGVYITIDNNEITISDKNKDTQLHVKVSDYSNAYCIFIRGSSFLLLTKKSMNKKERDKTMSEIIFSKEKRYIDDAGNVCFSTGFYYPHIKSIIESTIKIEEKNVFDL